jgi:citrate lyase subunit beta/citryl-CoA lyase
MRSLLFVPGDNPAKIAKAAQSGADVLLLDLEDSVAMSAKDTARRSVREALETISRQKGAPRLYVRVNALDTGLTEADLDAIMPGAPEGIMLPKSQSGADVQRLAVKLAVREAELGLSDGATRIIAIATETAASLFHMPSYAGASHRLSGLTWGAEDLSADLGAESNRLEDGSHADPYRLARALTLFGASAAQVSAIDTVFTAYRETDALTRECEAARRDGFSAKMAIHPAQVPVINAVFTPTAEMIAQSRAIVAAFRDDPAAGVVGIGGQMIDRPHLRRAERVLERARAAGLALD